MTPAQQRALDQIWPQYGLTNSGQSLDLKHIFGRSSEVVLEIGFGMGESLAAMAKDHPETDYIGIEVHRPGVGALLLTILKEGIENIRTYREDAFCVLNQSINDKSLSSIQVFFPDPWPKKRHHKRRLIQPDFVDLLHRKLKEGGSFHLATDWEDYAVQIMAVLSAHDGFQNTAGEGHFIQNQTLRPATKFENRGRRLGHGVWDLLFLKKDASTKSRALP